MEHRDDLKALRKQVDRYGIALMMIRSGAKCPSKIAADALYQYIPLERLEKMQAKATDPMPKGNL